MEDGGGNSISCLTKTDEIVLRKKRTADPSKWKKNIRKVKRLKGESYTDTNGNEKAARPMLPSPCANKTKHSCVNDVPEEARTSLYKEFRSLSSVDDQRQFLSRLLEQIPKKSCRTVTGNSRRKYTINYFFIVNGRRKQVCKDFFVKTLNVSDQLIRGTIKKSSGRVLVEKDRRGKHTPANKSVEKDEKVRKHINSFPTTQLGRKSSKRFLSSSLSIAKMHKLYLKQHPNFPVSHATYRRIFREYNLDFMVVKKSKDDVQQPPTTNKNYTYGENNWSPCDELYNAS